MRYRLQGSAMVGVPGLVAWAVNGYAHKKDRPGLLRVFTEGWSRKDNPANPSVATFSRLLKGEIPYKVDGDSVEFEEDVLCNCE